MALCFVIDLEWLTDNNNTWYILCGIWTGVPDTMRVSPTDEQVVENGSVINYNIDIVDQAENPTSAPRMSIICKVTVQSLM